MEIADYDPEKLALVPEHLREGLARHIEDGLQTGGALTAVLIDGRVSAVVPLLDDTSLAGIRGLLQFLHNYAPTACWGSPGKVELWRRRGGIRGQS